MVRRVTGDRGVGALKAQREKIELFDEGINDAHRVILTNIVIKASGSKVTCSRDSPSMNRFMGHLAQNGCTDSNFERAWSEVFSHSL